MRIVFIEIISIGHTGTVTSIKDEEPENFRQGPFPNCLVTKSSQKTVDRTTLQRVASIDREWNQGSGSSKGVSGVFLLVLRFLLKLKLGRRGLILPTSLNR